MPDEEIPHAYTGRPHAELLAAGTVLWRVHRRTRAPQDFKPFTGTGTESRFDATQDDPYPAMYAACRESTALAEVLLRSMPFRRREHRILGYENVWRRRLSPLVTQVELRLISQRDVRKLRGLTDRPRTNIGAGTLLGPAIHLLMKSRRPRLVAFVRSLMAITDGEVFDRPGDLDRLLKRAGYQAVHLVVPEGLCPNHRSFRGAIVWPFRDADQLGLIYGEIFAAMTGQSLEGR